MMRGVLGSVLLMLSPMIAAADVWDGINALNDYYWQAYDDQPILDEMYAAGIAAWGAYADLQLAPYPHVESMFDLADATSDSADADNRRGDIKLADARDHYDDAVDHADQGETIPAQYEIDSAYVDLDGVDDESIDVIHDNRGALDWYATSQQWADSATAQYDAIVAECEVLLAVEEAMEESSLEDQQFMQWFYGVERR